MKTYLWYDYETFGADPKRDRIAQFAGIRTDENFKIIDKVEHYCKLSEDYIPNYQACLITGITPQMANRRGMNEEKLSEAIYREFTKVNTVSIGYNSLKFDDEVTRNLFYRTLRDPYIREWKDGCSRWDFLRGVMGFYTVSRNKIIWPKSEDNKTSFKLEKLTEINGIKHKKAHDAMSDVKATIDMAKLLWERDKKLYNYIMSLRDKNFVNNLLREEQFFIHSDFSYGYDRDYTTLLYKVNIVKMGANDVIFLDLNTDLNLLKELEIDKLKELMYMKKEELAEGSYSRPGVKMLRTNQIPLLFKWNDYKDRGEFKWVDLEYKVKLAREIEMKYGHKLAKLFENKKYNEVLDVELDIYSGFPSPTDKGQFTLIHQDVKGYRPNFENKKYNELYYRWKAKNYFDLLSDNEKEDWKRYCYKLLEGELGREDILTFKTFEKEIEKARIDYKEDSESLEIIEKVYKYVVKLRREIKKNYKISRKKPLKKKGKTDNLTLF